MPPSDPATVRLADCPVGAVVQHPVDRTRFDVVRDSHYDTDPDTPVRLIAPSLAALAARAEAGERLADAVGWIETHATQQQEVSSRDAALEALAAYRKATA